MSFNHIIDNVNQSITNIEYQNITNDTYPRYYPHSVWLNVYENYDNQPMQVLNTCI